MRPTGGLRGRVVYLPAVSIRAVSHLRMQDDYDAEAEFKPSVSPESDLGSEPASARPQEPGGFGGSHRLRLFPVYLIYEERLKRCGVTTLKRGSREDLIETYEIVTGKEALQ